MSLARSPILFSCRLSYCGEQSSSFVGTSRLCSSVSAFRTKHRQSPFRYLRSPWPRSCQRTAGYSSFYFECNLKRPDRSKSMPPTFAFRTLHLRIVRNGRTVDPLNVCFFGYSKSQRPCELDCRALLPSLPRLSVTFSSKCCPYRFTSMSSGALSARLV